MPGLIKRWKRRNPRVSCAGVFLTVAAATALPLLGQQKLPPDLTQMKIEDLMEITVTSVSKKAETLSKTPAAVYVISQEDIRRSGATNLPDVLRMAPGVDVAQIDANAWAISVRGFNSRYSNKVLVLIDGRTVYTPSFSGVYWEQIDTPVENIERIEVIRGPGATVWGANAVNGVISIITKSSRESSGGLVTAIVGSHLKGEGLVQFGGNVGKHAAYRVFGNYFDVGDSAGAALPANDHWMRSHGGGRVDWDISPWDSLMVQADIFANRANQTRRSSFIPTPFDRFFDQRSDAAGGDVLARWSHTHRGGSQTIFQTYFDTYRRADMGVPEVLRTFDLDFQNHLETHGRHDIIWGLGYRVFSSALYPRYGIGFSPPSRTDSLLSGFLRDEVRIGNSVWLTLGCKVEHNPYTGVQTEPSAQIVWAPARNHTLWASASKAVRQPSRLDSDLEANIQSAPLGTDVVQVLRLYGNPDIKNEEARDYELGYRSEIRPGLSLDVAAFLTYYYHLETVEPQPMRVVPGLPTQYIIPMRFDNKARAVDYGGEVSLNWAVSSRWRIAPAYSYLHATIRRDPSSRGLASYGVDTGFPQNMLQIRSQVNLTRRLEFDQSLYYRARLPGSSLPGDVRFDVRLARRLGESAEVSLVGQNLLGTRSVEYGDSYGILATKPVKSVYGKFTWRF